jgi:pimeloyl-ACP methyl ester carboxylesterase
MLRAIAVAVLCLAAACRSLAAEATHYGAYIDGPWGQLHVRVEGRKTDPTVILVHQMVWSAEQYHFAQIALAERGIRSIALDIPGYGLSDGPPTPPNAAQYAETLIPVIKHFGLKRANLLGTNTGASFITAFADAHPDMVNSLILEGPTWWTAPETERLILNEYTDQIPGSDGRSVFNHANAWFAHDAVFHYDILPALGRLRAPTMILTFPGQGLYKTSLEFAKRYPQFALTVLDCKSQVASFDTPEPWADAVVAFLKQHR